MKSFYTETRSHTPDRVRDNLKCIAIMADVAAVKEVRGKLRPTSRMAVTFLSQHPELFDLVDIDGMGIKDMYDLVSMKGELLVKVGLDNFTHSQLTDLFLTYEASGLCKND